MGYSQSLFSLPSFVLSVQFILTVDSKWHRRCLDSIRGFPVSEATALPTAPQPQPLPQFLSIFLVFLSVRVTISVTRWLDYFSIFGHLTRLKSCPKLKNYAKVSSKFCQTLKKPFNICQRFIKFCQSSKISQNLVTLVTIFTWVFLSSKWWEISRNAIPVENIH